MRKISIAVCILASCAQLALAVPPDRINYQGVLRDNLDQPLDGNFDIVFRFYSAAAGGDQILVDSHSAPSFPVTAHVGLFSVQLGGGTVSDGLGPGIYVSLTNVFRDYGNVYLEVQVGAEILSPRIPILASPSALTSATASTLASGTHASSYTFSNPANSFSGNGSGLSNVTASTLAAGTHGNAYTLSNAANSFAGNGSGLSNVTASTLAAGTHGNAYTFSNAANSFAGNGAGLTNVAASTLAGGTHGNAYAFSNAANSFTGNGAGLTNIAASTLAAGTHGNAYSFSNAANSFSGSGSGLTNIDADLIDGADSASFLRSDSSDSFDSGTLTFGGATTLDVTGAIYLNGELRMDQSGPEGSQTIYFFDGSSPIGQRLEWNEGGDRFVVTKGLGVAGPIQAGISTPGGPAYNRFGGGTGIPDSVGITSADDVYVESDLEVDGVLSASGQLHVSDSGPDSNQGVLFFDDSVPGNEFLAWDDADDRFELSNDLAVRNALHVGSDTASPTSFSQFGASGAPSAPEITSSSDVYVAQDLEVDGFLALNGGMLMDDDGPDHDQSLSFYEDGGRMGESITWEDAADRFGVSDDLMVAGDLSASGAKSFVQNHPYQRDLSVVYTALEGDEVATFTRGSARLAGGEARVSLGETFAWVTNPDVGLTAYVTPRGLPVPLAVAFLSTTELVVRAPADTPDGLVLDYVVLGLRVGFEEFPPVREKTADAPLPARENHLEEYARRLNLREYNSLQRHSRMREASGATTPLDLAGATALRRAIGEQSPAHGEISSALPTAVLPAQPAGVPSPGQPAPGPAVPPAGPADDVYALSFRPRATDLATMVAVTETAEAGDVLVIDMEHPGAMRLARSASDTGVVGVLAAAPGVVLGSDPFRGGKGGANVGDASAPESAPIFAPVAVSGIALCKVDAQYGSVRPGDVLTTSPTPGHAMRADDPAPGTILGKALEPLEWGTGLVRILVTPR